MAKRLPLTDEEGEVHELTQVDFSRARPASRVLPEILGEDLAGQMLKRRPGRRGPQRAPVKRQVTLRLDPEVLDFFKATGTGWQTRINEALRRAMRKSVARRDRDASRPLVPAYVSPKCSRIAARVVSYKREARTLRIWVGNDPRPITQEVFSP